MVQEEEPEDKIQIKGHYLELKRRNFSRQILENTFDI